jgi:adenylate cyclase
MLSPLPLAGLLRRAILARPGLRQVRLVAGLVLFVYVTTHFIDHALGNISIAAMEEGLVVQKWIWQTPPGAIVLYAALVVHAVLGFWVLYERRHFRWTRLEATQLVLGLSIPFLLADHVIGTRVSLSLFGTQKGYAQELYKFWVNSPVLGVVQAIMLLIVWVHGCLGVHFWLRLKPFYPRARNVLLSLAVLLPVLALLGYFQGGRALLTLVLDPAWRASHLTPDHIGFAWQNAQLASDRNWFFAALIVTLAAIPAARLARHWRERRRGLVTLTYPERTVRVPRGLSVLDASLRYNIPHAHVCGGRGRCSTCRIRVVGGRGQLPTASPAEGAVLKRVRAGTGVRLACQLRPDRDVSFVPLLPPQANVANAYKDNQPHSGDERYVVMMFVDMRDSTSLAEHRLPFDTVFLINRFLNAVSRAVIAAGGAPNQILGDGLLALFGLGKAPAEACRQAVEACALIAHNVGRLSAQLADELPGPIRFGIGVHAGLVVLGDIGYEEYAAFTVIGDSVNVAARLQDLTRSMDCEVLMSEEVYSRAGFSPDALPRRDVAARGRLGVLQARPAARAADLADLLGESVVSAPAS